MVAAFLSLLMLFFLYDLGRGLTRGEIGWGQARRRRSEQPAEFWGHLAFAFLFVLAMGVSLLWYIRHGAWPELPLLQLVIAVLFSTLIIRALASGRASAGSVSFTRAEEPREYWALFAGGLLFLPLMWAPLVVKTYTLCTD